MALSRKKPVWRESLAAVDRLVASEWHPRLNDPLTPADVRPGSNLKVWWRCPLDPSHEWQARVAYRAIRKQGCPHCLGRTKYTPPGTLGPIPRALARQWHYEKNEPLVPGSFTRGSNAKVWWRCARNPAHEWRTSIADRAVMKTGCPYCANKRVDDRNNLAAMNPEIAAEWHPTKNGDLTPKDIVAGSARRVWWKCPQGDDHEWEEDVEVRGVRGYRCPFCVNQRVSITNALASTHPELARQWHRTKNGALTPNDVVAGSNRLVWWKCRKGADHEWRTPPNHRLMGRNCPFCAGQRVSITNALATCHPQVASEWHPSKNKKLKPSMVVATSNRKVWWRCAVAVDHEWETTINHRTRSGSGCPFCAGQRASVSNSLASLHPELAEQWHPTKNGELTPTMVTCGSTRKVWWKCNNGLDHEWDASLEKRTKRGQGCPFCSGRRVSITNSLAALYPHLIDEWHPTKNGDVTPETIGCGSHSFYWWHCPRGHDWRGEVRARTIRDQRCPICVSVLIS